MLEKAPIDIVGFYLNCMRAVLEEGTYSFFDSSEGYLRFTPPPHIIVSPSESLYPHLQHSHVVWAVQRIAEISYSSRTYLELTCVTAFKGRSEYTTIGVLTVQQKATAVSNNPTNINLPISNGAGKYESNRSIIVSNLSCLSQHINLLKEDQHAAINSTVQSKNPQSQNSMRIDLVYVEDGKKLHSIKVFLTIIRAMARIASLDYLQSLQERDWMYEDGELGVSITISKASAQGRNADYGQANQALDFIAKTMLANNRYAETEAWLYRDEPRRTDYATVSLRTYEAGAKTVQPV